MFSRRSTKSLISYAAPLAATDSCENVLHFGALCSMPFAHELENKVIWEH